MMKNLTERRSTAFTRLTEERDEARQLHQVMAKTYEVVCTELCEVATELANLRARLAALTRDYADRRFLDPIERGGSFDELYDELRTLLPKAETEGEQPA